MKRETKLWLRKRALMVLRAVIWHADEWLHRQEVKFREELSVCVPVEPPRPSRPQGPTVSCPYPFPKHELVLCGIRRRIPRGGQPQRIAKGKSHRGLTAAEFDLRFAR